MALSMNIVGKRLKQARKAAGLSLRALGEKVGVSFTAIRKYETGKIVPSSDILIKCAKIVRVHIEYFFRPEFATIGAIKFRKRNQLGKKAQEAIEHQTIEQLERRMELDNLLPSSYPAFSPDKIVANRLLSINDVEDIALKLRTHWNLGLSPIRDLIDVLENEGIKVLLIDCGDSDFDGFFTMCDQTPVIVISKQWPGDRQRFTLAHELAHCILLGKLPAEIDEEKACNRLAGAFLFPADSVIQRLGQVRNTIEYPELMLLKEEYGISMFAICYRSRDLNIINLSYFDNLRDEFRKRGWDKKEPGNQLPAENGHVFEQSVFRALGEEIIGDSKAAELLNRSIDEIRSFRVEAEYVSDRS